jgi:hypothetical protein
MEEISSRRGDLSIPGRISIRLAFLNVPPRERGGDVYLASPRSSCLAQRLEVGLMPPRFCGMAAPFSGTWTGRSAIFEPIDPALLLPIVTGPDFVFDGLCLLTPLRPINPPGSS